MVGSAMVNALRTKNALFMLFALFVYQITD